MKTFMKTALLVGPLTVGLYAAALAQAVHCPFPRVSAQLASNQVTALTAMSWHVDTVPATHWREGGIVGFIALGVAGYATRCGFLPTADRLTVCFVLARIAWAALPLTARPPGRAG